MGPSRQIPNRLRKYRRIAGYKQSEVAEFLGMQNSCALSRWEKGLSSPNIHYLFKLSTLYKTLVEELYYDVLIEARLEIEQKFKSNLS